MPNLHAFSGDFELVNVYVPEAGDIDWQDAVKLASDRDQAAADALKSDFVDQDSTNLNLEAAVKVAVEP